MRFRRETREKIHRLKAAEAEAARGTEARTITASEFAFWTSNPEWQIRKEIEAGTLPTRIGKRRRILITLEVRLRLEAGLKKVSAELGLDDHADESAAAADEAVHHDEPGGVAQLSITAILGM